MRLVRYIFCNIYLSLNFYAIHVTEVTPGSLQSYNKKPSIIKPFPEKTILKSYISSNVIALLEASQNRAVPEGF